MDVLHAYWVAGEFPRNRDYSDRRVPHFIDADGTACAVGHLMIESGFESMAREIATYENFDFVSEVDHPGVVPWLQAHGLTAEEAGWIQPGYGPCGFSLETVCGSDGNNYACEAVATQCAGVEVVSTGPCDGTSGSTTSSSSGTATGSTGSSGSDSGGSSTGASSTGGTGSAGGTGSTDAPIIGEEICAAGTSDGTDGSSEGDDTNSTTSDPQTTASGGQATDGPVQGEDEGSSGCRTGGQPPSILTLGLFALMGFRRRRG